MTLIIAIKNKNSVTLATDTLASDSDNQSKAYLLTPKLFKLGQMYIGFSGSYRVGQILQHMTHIEDYTEGDESRYLVSTVIPALTFALKSNMEDYKDDLESSGILIILNNRVFEVQSDLAILEYVGRYTAIGSGSDIALSVLMATEGLKMSQRARLGRVFDIASKMTTSVGEEHGIFKTG